jgi:hypothetical protein
VQRALTDENPFGNSKDYQHSTMSLVNLRVAVCEHHAERCRNKRRHGPVAAVQLITDNRVNICCATERKSLHRIDWSI